VYSGEVSFAKKILTKGLATDLVAVSRDLGPDALVHLVVAVAQLSGQQHNLGNDQLSDRARVGEGRVEDGDALLGRDLEVNLVGTNAEAANDAQLLGRIQDLLGQLGLGPNADAVHVLDLFDQHVFG